MSKLTHERRVVGHASGWKEQMDTCVCGKPWPCPELPTSDLLLSQIRRVTLHFINGTPSSFLIPANEVPRFVEASKRLHFKPGKNPHNGGETSRIWKITSATLKLYEPFWWTTPDLQENDDPAGAHTIDSYDEPVVFVDEETVKRWRAEEEAEEYDDL